MNTIQAVEGESSLGTWHKHIETIVNAANPGDTGDTIVTVSNVPSGTTMIAGYLSFNSPNRRNAFVKDMAGNIWSKIPMPLAAGEGNGWFEVPLDSNKQFLFSVDNGDVNTLSIFMRKYSK